MANIQKFKSAGCGHMFKHYERGYELNPDTGEVEYIRYHNQNIDTSRSHLNYNLAPARFNEDGTQMSQLEILKHRLQDEDVYYRKRADTNVMCSCCITKPKDLPDEEAERFFKTAYKFLENRYGKDNVISSYVHMDEVTPHMHFAFVPVAYDAKNKRLTVSAKYKVNRTDLQTLHPDLTKAMTKEFGYDIGIENGATREGNLTVEQLKAQEERCKRLEARNSELEIKIKQVEAELVIAKTTLKALQEPLEVVEALKGTNPLKKLFTPSQVKEMLQKAISFDDLNEKNKSLIGRLKEVEKERDKALSEVSEVERRLKSTQNAYEAMYKLSPLKVKEEASELLKSCTEVITPELAEKVQFFDYAEEDIMNSQLWQQFQMDKDYLDKTPQAMKIKELVEEAARLSEKLRPEPQKAKVKERGYGE